MYVRKNVYICMLSSLLRRLRSSVFMTQTFVPAYSRIIRGFLGFVRTPVSLQIGCSGYSQ